MEGVVTALHAVGVGTGDPQRAGHHAAVGSIEEVVVLTHLGEALCTDIVSEVIGIAIDLSKSILLDVAVLAAVVVAVFQSCGVVHITADIAASVHDDLAHGAAEHETIAGIHSTVVSLAVLAVIQAAVSLKEAVADLEQYAGLFIEVMPHQRGGALLHGEVAKGHIAVVIDPVGALFQMDPSSGDRSAAGPVVLGVLAVGDELTAEQDAILAKGVGEAADLSDTGVHLGTVVVMGLGAVGCCHSLPCSRQLTEGAVVLHTVDLHDSGVLALIRADTLLTQVIVVAVDLLDTGEHLTIHIVGEAAQLAVPAVLQLIDQCVGIGKGLVDALKVAALFALIIGIDKGEQLEGLLVLRLLCKGVQSAGTQTDLVADLAAVDHIEAALVAPLCILLGGQLDAADDAQRIGHAGIQRMGLVDPVQGQRHGVGLFIQLRSGQREVVVDQLHPGDIHIEVGVECDRGPDLRQHADTLCQLTQEGPGRRTLDVGAGQHVGQILQNSGDGDLGHVDGKDIGSDHILCRIDDSIDTGRLLHSIGDLAIPGQLTVAAGGTVKVESGLALLIQGHGEACSLGGICCQSDRDLHILDTGLFLTGEGEAVDGACIGIAQAEHQIGCLHSDGLAVIQRLHRQADGLTVDGRHAGLGEVHLIGDDHMDGLGADDLFAQHQIHIHITVSQAGEHTVLGDSTPSFIGNGPCGALGQLCGIAGSTDADRADLQFGADGHIVRRSLQDSMVECRRAGRSRDQHQRGGNGTGHTVGRIVHDAERLLTGLLCHIGRGAAAVQIDCMDTACLQHDLCDLLHAAAAGEGQLTAVHDHQHDLAGLGDARSSTGSAFIDMVIVMGHDHLAVSDQYIAKDRNGFLHTALVNGVVFFGRTDDCSTIIQYTDETVGIGFVVLHAAHDQHTAGLTGLHIEAGTVGGGDHIVVLDIEGAVGIAVLSLRGIGLILDTLHGPAFGGVIVVVVGKQMHIVSGDIGSGDVVDGLQTVSRGGILDILRDTGSQNGAQRVEHLEVTVLVLLHIVTGQTAQIVCERIAASLTQAIEIVRVEVAGAFQRGDHIVPQDSLIHRITHIAADGNTVQTVVQEVVSSVFLRQILSIISLHQHRKTVHLVLHVLHGIHEVEAIQIAVDIQLIEANLTVGRGHAQIALTDLCDHLGEAAGDTASVSELQQVDHIAAPTGHIGMVGAEVIVIGDIHHAKDMADIAQLAVGQFKCIQVLQTGDLDEGLLPCRHQFFVEHLLHHDDEFGKIGILIAGHDAPGAGIIALDTGADVLQRQSQRILAGILHGIAPCQFFQHLQIEQEFLVVVDEVGFQHGDLHIGVVAALQAADIRLPAHTVGGGLLGFHFHQDVVTVGIAGPVVGLTQEHRRRGFFCQLCQTDIAQTVIVFIEAVFGLGSL